jgi:hypothetical protein
VIRRKQGDNSLWIYRRDAQQTIEDRGRGAGIARLYDKICRTLVGEDRRIKGLVCLVDDAERTPLRQFQCGSPLGFFEKCGAAEDRAKLLWPFIPGNLPR